MNNISFQAHYIKPVQIVRAADNAKVEAAIIELDISSLGNMKAINRVANRFEENLRGRSDEYNYANDARVKFNSLYNVPSRRENETFYLMTTEKVNREEVFDTIDADKVIGVAQVNNNPKSALCEIKYFNIDPATNNNAEYRQYTKTGKAFLLGIEDIVDKSTWLRYDDNAYGFYNRMGYTDFMMDKLIHERKKEAKPTSPSE